MEFVFIPCGLYVVGTYAQKQRIPVLHYGILDVGHSLSINRVPSPFPLLFHLTPPRLACESITDISSWQLLHRIRDEPAAERRLVAALDNSDYESLRNNCEHFASFVAFGRASSQQVESVRHLARALLGM